MYKSDLKDHCNLFLRVQLNINRNWFTWWRPQMETFSALLAICAGNSLVTGEFPSQRLVTRSFDVFFDVRLNKWLGKQPRRRWFETPSRPLWRHCNAGNGLAPNRHRAITWVSDDPDQCCKYASLWVDTLTPIAESGQFRPVGSGRVEGRVDHIL